MCCERPFWYLRQNHLVIDNTLHQSLTGRVCSIQISQATFQAMNSGPQADRNHRLCTTSVRLRRLSGYIKISSALDHHVKVVHEIVF